MRGPKARPRPWAAAFIAGAGTAYAVRANSYNSSRVASPKTAVSIKAPYPRVLPWRAVYSRIHPIEVARLKLDKLYRIYARMCARAIANRWRRTYDGAGDPGEGLRES